MEIIKMDKRRVIVEVFVVIAVALQVLSSINVKELERDLNWEVDNRADNSPNGVICESSAYCLESLHKYTGVPNRDQVWEERRMLVHAYLGRYTAVGIMETEGLEEENPLTMTHWMEP
jgi:hypothetical protein